MATRYELLRGARGYPAAFEELGEYAPEMIYILGTPDVFDEMAISIIGARKATPYGEAVASMAGRIAAECGIVVVSGGALGCDSAAARAALDAGGKTIVVSGAGADLVYPSRSRDVFERAVETGGAVISERAWGSEPTRWAFPRRNRLIAALSPSLLVTEAGLRSGTASTAEAAMRMGKRLYAVPGSIFSPNSAFTNKLIGEGASIITTEQDLELKISLDYGQMRMIASDEGYAGSRVISALFAQPMRPDDLATSLGEDVLDMLKTLSDYELQGVIERLPDGRMSLTQEAYETHARMIKDKK